MSHDDNQPISPQPEDDDRSVEQPEPVVDDDPSSTVGMGTTLALGCIAGTILLIVIALIYLGLMAVL